MRVRQLLAKLCEQDEHDRGFVRASPRQRGATLRGDRRWHLWCSPFPCPVLYLAGLRSTHRHCSAPTTYGRDRAADRELCVRPHSCAPNATPQVCLSRAFPFESFDTGPFLFKSQSKSSHGITISPGILKLVHFPIGLLPLMSQSTYEGLLLHSGKFYLTRNSRPGRAPARWRAERARPAPTRRARPARPSCYPGTPRTARGPARPRRCAGPAPAARAGAGRGNGGRRALASVGRSCPDTCLMCAWTSLGPRPSAMIALSPCTWMRPGGHAPAPVSAPAPTRSKRTCPLTKPCKACAQPASPPEQHGARHSYS